MDIEYNSEEIMSKIFDIKQNDSKEQDDDACVLYRYSKIDIDDNTAKLLHVSEANLIKKYPVLDCTDSESDVSVKETVDDYIDRQLGLLRASESKFVHSPGSVRFNLTLDYDEMKTILDGLWTSVESNINNNEDQ